MGHNLSKDFASEVIEAKVFREYRQDQSFLLPLSLDEFVPEDHKVRIINDVVKCSIWRWLRNSRRAKEKEYRLKRLQEAKEILQGEKLERVIISDPQSRRMQDSRWLVQPTCDGRLRGVEKVRGEFSLMCLVHNVNKIVKRVVEGPPPFVRLA